VQTQLSHKEAKGLFMAALDDELADHDESQLQAHLDECGECRTRWERYSRTVKRVRRTDRERAPAALSTVIMRRVRRRRFLGARRNELANAYYRFPAEAVIPILIGVLVAAMLVMLAP
jgi:anti-sigma factor RsiW